MTFSFSHECKAKECEGLFWMASMASECLGKFSGATQPQQTNSGILQARPCC
jgi:hypothetical protein